MESFTIELHSSASGDVFPLNSSASFSNLLPEQINLDGQWEVALTEISYPSKIFNVTRGQFEIVVESREVKQSQIFNISSGFYHSIDSLIEAILKKIFDLPPYKKYIDKVSSLFTCTVDPLTNQLQINGHDGFDLVLLSEDLQHIFGYFPSEFGININQNSSTPLSFDIQRFHSILIYTDFINSSIVGDTKAPILKTFAIENSSNSGIRSKTFKQLDFRSILKHSIHSITVELRSPTGELIPFFSCGYTRLNLLFRKVGQ